MLASRQSIINIARRHSHNKYCPHSSSPWVETAFASALDSKVDNCYSPKPPYWPRPPPLDVKLFDSRLRAHLHLSCSLLRQNPCPFYGNWGYYNVFFWYNNAIYSEQERDPRNNKPRILEQTNTNKLSPVLWIMY